jgi:hypothetical protein
MGRTSIGLGEIQIGCTIIEHRENICVFTGVTIYSGTHRASSEGAYVKRGETHEIWPRDGLFLGVLLRKSALGNDAPQAGKTRVHLRSVLRGRIQKESKSRGCMCKDSKLC